MLECFLSGSNPADPSFSPICYIELLYNGGAAPFEEVFPLPALGDPSCLLLILASDLEPAVSEVDLMLYLRTDMMSKLSFSRYIRLRRKLSFTIFSYFLMVLDLRPIFCSKTYIMLIWQRPSECIFLRSFLALPGTLGALRFDTSLSVDVEDALSCFRRYKHRRTSFG